MNTSVLPRHRGLHDELLPDAAPFADEAGWLLEQAAGQLGVRRRLEALLAAFDAAERPEAERVEGLRELLLGDFGFWSNLPDGPRAVALLVELLAALERRTRTTRTRERLIRTGLEVLEAARGCSPAAGWAAVLDGCLSAIEVACGRDPEAAARASSYLKSQAGAAACDARCGARLERLLHAALTANLAYWQRTADLDAWFRLRGGLLGSGYEARAASLGRSWFAGWEDHLSGTSHWPALVTVPDFDDLKERFRTLFDGVPSCVDRAHYLLFLLDRPGFTEERPRLLGELARVLSGRLGDDFGARCGPLFDCLFGTLRRHAGEQPAAVRDCLVALGRGVFANADPAAVGAFKRGLLDLGVRLAGAQPAGTNRPVLGEEVRAWLEIIALDPPANTDLMAALVAHAELFGVEVRDGNLLQRQASALLNAPIAGCWREVLQLARVLPIFFDEIGAEGELREVSTRVDELVRREDPLTHFLRKQVHAESGTGQIALVEAVLDGWARGDLRGLAGLVPAEIVGGVQRRFFEGEQRAVQAAAERLECAPGALLRAGHERVRAALAASAEAGTPAAERVAVLVRLHELLRRKYGLEPDAVPAHMRSLERHGLVRPGEVERLQALRLAEEPRPALRLACELMARLRGVVLDPRPSEGEERLYHKRHIADGMPSMCGTYWEPKFAALGLLVRLERLAEQLLTRIVERAPLAPLTRDALRGIAQVLADFQQALHVSAGADSALDEHLRMLQHGLDSRSITAGRLANLLQFMAADVRQTVDVELLQRFEPILRGLFGGDGEEVEFRQRAESFYRSLISRAFLLGPLDAFLAAAVAACEAARGGAAAHRVLELDLDAIVSPLDEPRPQLDDASKLGGKGYWLKRLHAFRHPVPPGFVLTTDLFKVRDLLADDADLRRAVAARLERAVHQLEAETGRRFGDPARPLLLAVRSGAAISMPGAMTTFVNVGLNEALTEALSRQPNYGWTSWDCLRRLLQTWGMAHGIPRDAFDAVITEFKARLGVARKVELTPAQMREIALAYGELLRAREVVFEEQPRAQLLAAVMGVLRSWDSASAAAYRSRLGIADDWGTAVVVQQMVLGNIGLDSGTGVAFTCDPHAPSGPVTLWGDFTTTSQGEDVVAGLVHPLPVSERQCDGELERGPSLQRAFPDIYEALLARARDLVTRRGLGHQEIEFTFESRRPEDLYLLQTREYRGARAEAEPPEFVEPPPPSDRIGVGIGVAGGACSGLVAFDLLDLQRLAEERPGCARVLVRPDTVPEDVAMIFECEGVLTARGGATSHAAVTAASLGRSCVVNCRALKVDDAQRCCSVGETVLRAGDPISIDGRSGHIYRGPHPVAGHGRGEGGR